MSQRPHPITAQDVALLNEYQREHYEERAGIMEHDGLIPRREAELRAYRSAKGLRAPR